MTVAISFTTACAAIRERLDSQFAVDILHDNGVAPSLPNATLQVVANIHFTESELIEVSAKRHRYHGIVSVELKSPIRTGDSAILAQCDIIRTNFNSVEVDGITYRTPKIDRVGEKNGWYRVIADCPFYFEI